MREGPGKGYQRRREEAAVASV